MKKPETFKDLFKLVNPQDLLDVIDFSGINDYRNVEHCKIRRALQDRVYNSLNYKVFDEVRKHRNEPKLLNTKMEDIHYEIIVESLQDFYYWGRQFTHIHSHIFQRVQNALDIPLEDISIIMESVK